jgi:diguanylate cyclase (GGDEF)-like protein
VRGRLILAITVPMLLLCLVSIGYTGQRSRDVSLAHQISTDLGMIDRLVALRAATFEERLAAELLLDGREPPPSILDDIDFGARLLERPGSLAAATDRALSALPPAHRPFTAEELREVRAARAEWEDDLAAIREELGPFYRRTTASLRAVMLRVRDRAVELGDPELIAASLSFHHSVVLPERAGEMIAALTDLWVASPAQRPQYQSEVARYHATYLDAVERFESTVSDSSSAAATAMEQLRLPADLDRVVRSALLGELTDPERRPVEPASVGVATLQSIDWILAVDRLPLLTSQEAGHAAANLAADARREEVGTALVLLAVIGVCLAGAVVLARSILVPVRRLTDRAQQIGAGQLDVDPLTLHGPPEVVGAMSAFNDVVDNLLLLEQKSHALAECNFEHPSLRQPLPGLLGAELQRSVRVLSGSIVERERLQSRLVYQATHDTLTGLANRAALVDTLVAAAREGAETCRRIAVVFVDLDGFKRANDRYGHSVGDELLREVAVRLKRVVPRRCTVARFGGDEFVVVVPGVVDPGQPTELARALVRSISEPVEIDGTLLSVGASAGVAISTTGASESASDPLDLLRRADLAVYSAKRNPQQSVAMYDGDLDREIMQQEDVEEALLAALRPGASELRMVFQPILRAEDGELHGVESLVRWDRPEHGRVPPDAFVPIAERSSLIVKLDRWVLRTVLRQVAAWSDSDVLGGVPVSVNVSGRSLLDPGFVTHVLEALDEVSVPPALLKIEVTETAIVTDLELAAAQLRQLRQLGVQVVIDDFGTGYTSVAHLRSMPVDELKIDGSFVQRLPDEENRVLIQMIHQLAHHLAIPTVAEGVETAEQIEHLRDIGCDALQGYLFSRPLEHDELVRWVRARVGTRSRTAAWSDAPAVR